MAKSKPVQARLSDLTPGQFGDFFALLAEKTKGATREGKAYYACRFRDARRTAAFMVWADGPWFARAKMNGRPASSTNSAPSMANTSATARNSSN